MTKTVRDNYTTKGYGGGPEKDLIEDPKIARRSTTFYAQAEPEKVESNQEANAKRLEKVSTIQDTHNQRKYLFSIQKLLEPTLLSWLSHIDLN